MSQISIKSGATQLSLPSSSPIEISRNGLTLTLSFNTEGGFTLKRNGVVLAAAYPQPSAAPIPGSVMADGTVYAGLSPETGQAFYAAAKDAPEVMTWGEAEEYARSSAAHGHSDWRLPTLSELNVMFNNRTAIGGFNLTGWGPKGLYWSASESSGDGALTKTFKDGALAQDYKGFRLSFRCVRG
jgi:hypothetical protein